MNMATPATEAITNLSTMIDDITRILDQEPALVRAGRLAEATTLQAAKTELANRFYDGTRQLKAQLQNGAIGQSPALDALKRKHEDFHRLMQVNLTVLATAHAVSEGIIRGVSEELTRKAAPSTYGATGRANAPGASAAQPLAVSRVL
jgi:hypothetical protein